MPVPTLQPHDSTAIVAIVLFVAAVCAKYWRTVLLMIMIAIAQVDAAGVVSYKERPDGQTLR